MRILVVSPALPHLPSHDATRLAASHLINHLTERHALGVVAATAPGDTPAGRAWLTARATLVDTMPARPWRHALSGRPAHGLQAIAAAVQRASAVFRPDVVHLESALLAPLARVTGAPCVLACHESATLRARDAARYPAPTWQRLRARLDEHVETGWARAWFDGVAACVVNSDHDRQAVATHLPFERIEVISTGIDVERYAYRRIGQPGRLVFTGDLGSPAGVDAARRLATSILPLVRRRAPRTELLIAGTGSAASARDLASLDGVRVEGNLADLRPSVWGAAVYVSPLAIGSGPVARILESLALGTPVVASSASLSRLDDAVPGHHVLAAESDADFADAVSLLLREPVVANTIARNGRALVERCLTWRMVAERYEDLYARLAQAGTALAA